ncbi:MAG: Bug family tripartite tricarboxylate transporter substrate binding protein [Candidatus Binatia bacterium]
MNLEFVIPLHPPFKSSKVQAFKVLGLLIFSVVELLNPLNLERLFAQANFYQGKTLRIIVGNLPGDTHDLFARAYSRSMGKHIPGNPAILVQNMPGAGTMIAANHVYNIAKPDGLTLGSLSPALYYAQITGSKEAKFDWPKFTWIGSPERNGSLLFMRSDTPYKTLDDIRNAKEPPRCSATGVGTNGHDIPKLFEETIGLRFAIITGYPGGAEQDLAMERGEVQCRAITIAAFFAREPFVSWYKNGFVRVLIQTPRQRNAKIPDVPTLYELMEQYKTPEIKRRQAFVYLGAGGFGSWPILATPSIPAERVTLLRDAFTKTVKDPDFLAEAKKSGWEIRPIGGEELQALAREVVDHPPEVVEWLKKLLAK